MIMKKVIKKKVKSDNLSLAVKYRPLDFDHVYGQDGVKELLITHLALDSCPRVMLFYGPRGCGKTTVARIVANMLGARGRDLVEFNIAHTGGKDRAREIADNANYAPFESDVKIYIFDECHRATKDFQDALLKVIEEPPPYVYFIFCTTEEDRLLATIKSRCTPFEFSPLKSADLKKVIDNILESEDEVIDTSLVREIISQVDGDCRRAIKLLEMTFGVEEPNIESILPIASRKDIRELCRALLDGKGWKIVSGMLKGLREEDHEQIRRAVLRYMGKVLLSGDNIRAYMILEAFSEPWHSVGGYNGLIYSCYAVAKAKELMKI